MKTYNTQLPSYCIVCQKYVECEGSVIALAPRLITFETPLAER